MTTYFNQQPIELTRKDFSRINRLFQVNFDEDTKDMQQLIDATGARRNTNPATFWWHFDNGYSIVFNVESDDVRYYDKVFLIDEGTGLTLQSFPCDFSLDEEKEFDYKGDTYICQVNLVDKK